jgi:uncharacterized protein YcbX
MTTVARLLHTPVKSLKMGEVDQLVLHERGVVDDRIYPSLDAAYHAVFLRRVNDLRSS